MPSITSLDELAPDNPSVVIANSGHAAYGNSLAFRAAGITRNIRDPVGAKYVRGSNGALTGEAREAAAVLALSAPLMNSKGGDLGAKLLWACEEYAKAGITTVTEMAYDFRTRAALTGLTARPDFPVRLRVYQMGTLDLAGREHRNRGNPQGARQRARASSRAAHCCRRGDPRPDPQRRLAGPARARDWQP